MNPTIDWLLNSDEPWTQYRVLVDLLELAEDEQEVAAARARMLAHPQVQRLIAKAASWGEEPLKRHNDASHALYSLSTLADFGIRTDDPGLAEVAESILRHQSEHGAFQTLVYIPSAFGGKDEDVWSWIACDAPTLLYSLQSLGVGDDRRIRKAQEHLISLSMENGYRCSAAPELGRFRGPGRRDDPCPVANMYTLKALSLLPDQGEGDAAHQAAEMLLGHWQQRGEKKYYLFGVGSDFRKLKYPFVWYDILHVCDVLSRFQFTHADQRFKEMLAVLTSQADEAGRYTATSMYTSWKGWSFADKKHPSAWLTFLVLRILKRVGD
jgi:hypothetical protein